MYAGKFCSAIIVAAGSGKRMGSSVAKQYLMLCGKTIIEHTVGKFLNCDVIDEIIIVTSSSSTEDCKSLFEGEKITFVCGGAERYNSVYNGIMAVSDKCDIVLIHDGVRPFVSEKIIVQAIEAAEKYGACAVGVNSKDTVKICDENGLVVSTPVRDNVFSIQTPQSFKKDIILRAYEYAFKNKVYGTDDASLVENIGCAVRVIQGYYENIKITTPEDLAVGEKFLEKA